MKRVLSTAAVTVLSGVVLLSCGRPPRPPELAHADQVSEAPSMRDAAALAPQAVAHAEQLRRQAQQAYERGETATSSILAERSVVAYERAAVLARIARAGAEAQAARRDLEASQSRLRELEAEQRRVEADTASTENLINVIRDAEPIVGAGATTADREQARFEAARSIAVDARLLCAAASLLGRQVDGLKAAQAEVSRLEELLSKQPRPVPIDESMRARAQCLALLTLSRRAGPQGAVLANPDVVLTELSAGKSLEPRRDERGIVLTLRGEALASDQSTRQALAPVLAAAAAHPDFPLLVVAHTSTRPAQADIERANAMSGRVERALAAGGIAADRLRSELAKGALPVLAEPLPPPRPSRNERVEIILVTPGG